MAKAKSRSDIIHGKNGKRNSIDEPAIALRVGVRAKKAKVVFDPSENNVPKKRLSRSMSMSAESSPAINIEKNSDTFYHKKKSKLNLLKCSFDKEKKDIIRENDGCTICSKNKPERKKICCVECNRKVHISCLKIKFQNDQLLEENWRCDYCAMCSVCYETTAEKLLTCTICVGMYHIGCHYPKVYTKYMNKFQCSKCRNINKTVSTDESVLHDTIDKKANINKSLGSDYSNDSDKYSSSSTSTISQINPSLIEASNIEKTSLKQDESTPIQETIVDTIPDISKWTIDEVSQYIGRYFPIQADIFRENEIDGPSLLLMKRSDILQLPIKLGPAVSIYTLIVRLQAKSNDPKLTWM